MIADALVATLFAWAVTLSGYSDRPRPVVVQVPHRFLVDRACYGRPCKVIGWHPRGNVIYIDSNLDPESTFGSSIIVHEMVHYLQDEAGFASDCAGAMAQEREAYAVQGEFLRAYGSVRLPGASMHGVGCS